MSRLLDTLYQELAHINVQRILAEMAENGNRQRYWKAKRQQCLDEIQAECQRLGLRGPVMEQRDLFEDVPFEVVFPSD